MHEMTKCIIILGTLIFLKIFVIVNYLSTFPKTEIVRVDIPPKFICDSKIDDLFVKYNNTLVESKETKNILKTKACELSEIYISDKLSLCNDTDEERRKKAFYKANESVLDCYSNVLEFNSRCSVYLEETLNCLKYSTSKVKCYDIISDLDICNKYKLIDTNNVVFYINKLIES